MAEWTAKHSISPHPDQAALAKRKLPESPGKSNPESTDDSLVNANDMMLTKIKQKRSDTRPFERSNKMLLKNMGNRTSSPSLHVGSRLT